MNVFTQCNYTTSSVPASVDEITSIRDAEDSEFAARCKLTRHTLGLPEATVLGLDPFDLDNIQQEVEQLEKPLIGLILSLAAEMSETEIYCPLAVGRHRNHISVFLAVIKTFNALKEKSRIFFYEDLPYASHPGARDEALKRLAYYFPPSSLTRHVNEMTPHEFDEKMELVSLYKSQHRGPAIAGRFIPADPQAPFPHEAFWEVRS